MSDETALPGQFKGSELTYADWKEVLDEGTILGQKCDDCGHATAAPKSVCTRCGSQSLEAIALPTKGTVYSETTLEVTPAGFDDSYQVALVTLGDAKIMVHITGDVSIGDTVAFVDVVRADGQFAPVFEAV